MRDGTIRLTSKVDLTGLRPTVQLAHRGDAAASQRHHQRRFTNRQDTKGTASLAVAGTFKGTLDLGPEGVKLRLP